MPIRRFSSLLICALGAILAWGLFARPRPASPQALSVSFIGYTNVPIFGRVAYFAVSNQLNITIKRWAVLYIESAPFQPTNSIQQWLMDSVGGAPDVYLKPKATEGLFVRDFPAGREWRLQVPWSSGTRARIHLALRKFRSSALDRLSVAKEYYASSNPVTD